MPTLTIGFNEIESIIAKTMEYLSIPAVVGHERHFLEYLEQQYNAMGLEATLHPQLLEVHGDTPHSAIVCAHIDRHGLISIGGGQYAYAAQYVREIKYGEQGQTTRAALELISKRFDGEQVFAFDPETMDRQGLGTLRTCDPCMDSGDSIFYVDGMDEMPEGAPLAYARTAKSEDGKFRGQIDNAMCVGIMHALFKHGFQGTALFTTEEEIGKSWLHISEYLEQHNIETKELLVLDTSPFLDTEIVEDGDIVLRRRDKTEKFNEDLVERLKARCRDIGLPYIVKDLMMLRKDKDIKKLGSTELGRLVEGHKGRWNGATIQIATNMYHTSKETTTEQAIKSYFRFLANILIEDPMDFKIDVKTL